MEKQSKLYKVSFFHFRLKHEMNSIDAKAKNINRIDFEKFLRVALQSNLLSFKGKICK